MMLLRSRQRSPQPRVSRPGTPTLDSPQVCKYPPCSMSRLRPQTLLVCPARKTQPFGIHLSVPAMSSPSKTKWWKGCPAMCGRSSSPNQPLSFALCRESKTRKRQIGDAEKTKPPAPSPEPWLFRVPPSRLASGHSFQHLPRAGPRLSALLALMHPADRFSWIQTGHAGRGRCVKTTKKGRHAKPFQPFMRLRVVFVS